MVCVVSYQKHKIKIKLITLATEFTQIGPSRDLLPLQLQLVSEKGIQSRLFRHQIVIELLVVRHCYGLCSLIVTVKYRWVTLSSVS